MPKPWSKKIVKAESDLHHIRMDTPFGKIDEGDLFDIDAHYVCAMQYLFQARESFSTTGNEGKSLDDAIEHINRIKVINEKYKKED